MVFVSVMNKNNQNPISKKRVWMHCDEGLTLSKASMSRFMIFCLTNDVEIGSIYAFNPKHPRSSVIASVRIDPSKIQQFEQETGGKLKKPPKISLN